MLKINQYELTFYCSVNNIFTNIIKHAKATKIVIEAIESEKEIRVDVKDNGKGISKIEQEKIRNSWMTRKYTSLGLLIILKIVEAHNGKIEFVSNVNKGTTISLYFPR